MVKVKRLIIKNLDLWASAVKTNQNVGRGSRSKNELYGTKKLRALILDLAIRGFLTPQNPNDETVTKSLKRITAAKNRLFAEGVIKKQTTSEISEDEYPFNLPKGWQWVRLCEVAYSQAGFAFSSKNFNQSKIGIPLVRIRDVGQSFSETFYDGIFKEEYLIDNNDYLISMDGIFRVARWSNGQALLNQRVSRLIFFGNEHSKEFCSISLQSRLSELQGTKAYTTVDHLSGRQISNALIPFPPLAEQHRIISKVDELMKICDQLELEQESNLEEHENLVSNILSILISASRNSLKYKEAWQRIKDNFDILFTTERSIDTLIQTIFKLAVRGKLVPQDPEDEPADSLLKKITEKKEILIEEGSLKKQKKLPAILEQDQPYQIPVNWRWVRFNDAFDIRDGTHDSPQDAIGDNTYPLVTTKDFKNGKIDFTGAKRISSEDHVKICERSNVEVNDILFSMIGSIGNQVIVEDPRPFSIKNVALFKYYSQELTVPKFLKIYTEELAFGLKQKASGAVQPFISLGFLRNLPFALPPTAEQHRIVAKVDELINLCHQLKKSIISTKTIKINLAESIVEKAIK